MMTTQATDTALTVAIYQMRREWAGWRKVFGPTLPDARRQKARHYAELRRLRRELAAERWGK